MAIENINGIQNNDGYQRFLMEFDYIGDNKIDAADFNVFINKNNVVGLYNQLAKLLDPKQTKKVNSQNNYFDFTREMLRAMSTVNYKEIPGYAEASPENKRKMEKDADATRDAFVTKFISYVDEQGTKQKNIRVKAALIDAGLYNYYPQYKKNEVDQQPVNGYSRGVIDDKKVMLDISADAEGSNIVLHLKEDDENKESGWVGNVGGVGTVPYNEEKISAPNMWGALGYKFEETGAVVELSLGTTPATRDLVLSTPEYNKSIFNKLDMVDSSQLAAGLEIGGVSKPKDGATGWMYGAHGFGGGLFMSDILKADEDTGINNGLRYYFGGSMTIGYVGDGYNLRLDGTIWGQKGRNSEKDLSFDDKEYFGDTMMTGYGTKFTLNTKHFDLVANYEYMRRTDEEILGSPNPETKVQPVLIKGQRVRAHEIALKGKYKIYDEETDLSTWWRPAIECIASWGTGKLAGEHRIHSTYISAAVMLDQVQLNQDGHAFSIYLKGDYFSERGSLLSSSGYMPGSGFGVGLGIRYTY